VAGPKLYGFTSFRSGSPTQTYEHSMFLRLKLQLPTLSLALLDRG